MSGDGGFQRRKLDYGRTLQNARLVPRTEAFPHLPGAIRLAMRLMRIEWYIRADL